MLSVTSSGTTSVFSMAYGAKSGDLYATCGKGRVRIPITSDGRIVLPTTTYVFRPVVFSLMSYDPDLGLLSRVEMLSTFAEYLPRLMAAYPHDLWRISNMSQREASLALDTLLAKVMSKLYGHTTWEREPVSSFEVESLRLTVTMAESPVPHAPGMLWNDVRCMQRMNFMRYLVDLGISGWSATAPGNPGVVADVVDSMGYPLHVRIQPLAHLLPKNRWKTARGLTHLLPITGKEAPFVLTEGCNILPEMANLLCVGVAWEHEGQLLGKLTDAVIMSRSSAEKLCVLKEEIHNYDVHQRINARSGLFATGKNGRLTQSGDAVKIQSGEAARVSVTHYGVDPLSALRSRLWNEWRRSSGSLSKAAAIKKHALLEKGMTSAEFELKYGDGTSSAHKRFASYLANNIEFQKLRIPTRQPIARRFESGNVERLVIPRAAGNQVIYREYYGIKEIGAAEGMKVQSEADAFKGVACILDDDDMPYVRWSDGSIQKVDVVFDITSAVKHNSLKAMCLTMAFNKIGKDLGGLVVNHAAPIPSDHIVAVAQEHGYASDDLTVELLEPDAWRKGVDVDTADNQHYATPGAKVLGVFPAGYLRVGRHRQDPETVGGAVGTIGKRYIAPNTLKASGRSTSFIDSYVQLASGLPHTMRELRPLVCRAEAELEDLRRMLYPTRAVVSEDTVATLDTGFTDENPFESA